MEENQDHIMGLFTTVNTIMQEGRYDIEMVANMITDAEMEQNVGVIGSADRKALEYARDHNIDVLTSGQTGSKTITELAATRPLWLGVATQCVAVGILSPEVGIAGAHFLSATRENIKDGWKTLIAAGPKGAREEIVRMREGGQKYLIKHIVSMQDRINRVIEAIEAASDLYTHMESRVLPKGRPNVCITGLDYCSPEEIKTLNYHAEKMLKRKLSNPTINLKFGTAGGVVYGGPNHPQYNQPIIIREPA